MTSHGKSIAIAGVAVRVVADTNVLVSGALWPGPSHRIIELAEAGEVILCVTETMIEELKGVLQRRKFQARLRALRTSPEEILSSLLPLAELYEPIDASGTVPPDPDDEMFIACAVSAGAAVIISGDDHLLRLKQHGTIRIVRPTEFL